MAESHDTTLFAEFPSITSEAWREKIEQDLKGKPIDRLNWDTGEGFVLKPYYRQEDLSGYTSGLEDVPGKGSMRRGNQFNAQDSGWQIIQEMPVTVDGLGEKLAEAQGIGVHAFRLVARDAKPFAALLADLPKELPLHQTALHLAFPEAPSLVAADLYAQLAERKVKADLLTGTLHNDPIGVALADGEVPSHVSLVNVEAGIESFEASPWFRSVELDLGWVYEQGGNLTQQLAIALASVVEYVDFLEKSESKVGKEDLFKRLAFNFPVGTSFFLEMAKFRAFRLLFTQLAEAYELHDTAMSSPFVMGRISEWHYTHYDAYNNLLRATTGAMSAVIGGVQGLTIPGFDTLQGIPSDTSLRLARNIQHLLQHETYLDQVKDPAGGSYYLEAATEEMAKAAWKLFQEIEEKGGIVEAANQGVIQEWIKSSRERKADQIAKRKTTQVGVNQYAHPSETLPELEVASDDLRQSAPFERIRQQMDAFGAQRGQRVSAFLLLFGDVRMRNARAQFARNLISAGGLDIQETQYQTDVEKALAETVESQPEVVVLCAGDSDYFEQAPDMLSKLRTALPNARIILAGQPEGWADLDVDQSIAARMNALGFLEELSQTLIG